MFIPMMAFTSITITVRVTVIVVVVVAIVVPSSRCGIAVPVVIVVTTGTGATGSSRGEFTAPTGTGRDRCRTDRTPAAVHQVLDRTTAFVRRQRFVGHDRLDTSPPGLFLLVRHRGATTDAAGTTVPVLRGCGGVRYAAIIMVATTTTARTAVVHNPNFCHAMVVACVVVDVHRYVVVSHEDRKLLLPMYRILLSNDGGRRMTDKLCSSFFYKVGPL